MSALGNRLRADVAELGMPGSNYAKGAHDGLRCAARMADEYEAAALAESAQGRGPHAAATLRWAADAFADYEPGEADPFGALNAWADQAEQPPVRVTQ